MAGNIKKWEKEIKKENAVDIEFDKDIELSLLFEGDYALYKVGADQYLDITKSNQSYVSLYLSDDFDGLMDSKKQLNYYSNYHFSYIENESYLLIYANENDASVNVKFKSIKKDSAEKLEYGKDYECNFENAGDFKFYKVEEGQYLDIMTSNKSNVSLYLSDEFDRLNYSKKKVCDYSDYNISYIENESYLLIFANEKDASVNVKFKSIKEESAERIGKEAL